MGARASSLGLYSLPFPSLPPSSPSTLLHSPPFLPKIHFPFPLLILLTFLPPHFLPYLPFPFLPPLLLSYFFITHLLPKLSFSLTPPHPSLPSYLILPSFLPLILSYFHPYSSNLNFVFLPLLFSYFSVPPFFS